MSLLCAATINITSEKWQKRQLHICNIAFTPTHLNTKKCIDKLHGIQRKKPTKIIKRLENDLQRKIKIATNLLFLSRNLSIYQEILKGKTFIWWNIWRWYTFKIKKNFKSTRVGNRIEEKVIGYKKKFLDMNMIVRWCLKETVITSFL